MTMQNAYKASICICLISFNRRRKDIVFAWKDILRMLEELTRLFDICK